MSLNCESGEVNSNFKLTPCLGENFALRKSRLIDLDGDETQVSGHHKVSTYSIRLSYSDRTTLARISIRLGESFSIRKKSVRWNGHCRFASGSAI